MTSTSKCYMHRDLGSDLSDCQEALLIPTSETWLSWVVSPSLMLLESTYNCNCALWLIKRCFLTDSLFSPLVIGCRSLMTIAFEW